MNGSNTFDTYLGCARFEPLPGQRIFCLRIFQVFLNPFRQTPAQDCFLPDPLNSPMRLRIVRQLKESMRLSGPARHMLLHKAMETRPCESEQLLAAG
jgi:hypothetical protein